MTPPIGCLSEGTVFYFFSDKKLTRRIFLLKLSIQKASKELKILIE
jgi:hypothetical protein